VVSGVLGAASHVGGQPYVSRVHYIIDFNSLKVALGSELAAGVGHGKADDNSVQGPRDFILCRDLC
jgi:hypothetical protein